MGRISPSKSRCRPFTSMPTPVFVSGYFCARRWAMVFICASICACLTPGFALPITSRKSLRRLSCCSCAEVSAKGRKTSEGMTCCTSGGATPIMV